MSVRVRFAPSPTGYLHVGGARTALFNYLFAKKQKGTFILRIEDTDQDRHQESSITSILENLKWLGLDWDEGPFYQNGKWKDEGPYAPYRQKDRLSIYKTQSLKLIEQGLAYYCFMSSEKEAQQKAQSIKENKTWRVSSPYRNLDLVSAKKRIQQGQKYCIRFKTPETKNPYIIKDLLRGEVHFPADSLGDFILIRTGGFPVYNFSCAVDDGLMKISHVFRAEEHLSNSLKQKLIQEALGFTPPQIGHLSIILGKDKKKLSKRTGATSVGHYEKEGYLPCALINFLALLGWNPKTKKEFFYKEELIQSFSLEGLNLSAGIFDEDKLLWLNSEHIKTLSDKQLSQQVKIFSKEQIVDDKLLQKVIPYTRSSFKTLKQIMPIVNVFSDTNFSLKESALPVLKWPKSKTVIKKWIAFLKEQKQNIDHANFKTFQKKLQNEEQIKGKNLFWPIRCALMGQPEGTELKILIQLLEKDQMLKRANKALEYIELNSEQALP